MRRSARRSAGPLAVVVLIALAIAGCGSAHHRSRQATVSLCIDLGLATTGTDSAVGTLVSQGVHAAIPSQGVAFRGYRIRLCDTGYPGGGDASAETSALLANAVSAVTDRRTVGYIGALTSVQAADTDAVLAPAQIPLITPSPATPTDTSVQRRPAPAGAPTRRTSFALMPSASAQARAVQSFAQARGCSSFTSAVASSRRVIHCLLEEAPFCTNIPGGGGLLPLLCVVPGALTPPQEPAVAYGYAAAELLVDTLKRIAAGGGDIANRSVVLDGLARADLARSPIGPIRFDTDGAIVTDRYSVYTVKASGQPQQTGTFTTH